MVSKKKVTWLNDLYEAVGTGFVRLETTDGGVREGRLSAIESRTIMVNGKACRMPIELQLNDDGLDCVAFATLKKIDIE